MKRYVDIHKIKLKSVHYYRVICYYINHLIFLQEEEDDDLAVSDDATMSDTDSVGMYAHEKQKLTML